MSASAIKEEITKLLKKQNTISRQLQRLENRPATISKQTKINRGRSAGALIYEYFKLDREIASLRLQHQLIEIEKQAALRKRGYF